jgi:hypothetical protein
MIELRMPSRKIGSPKLDAMYATVSCPISPHAEQSGSPEARKATDTVITNFMLRIGGVSLVCFQVVRFKALPLRNESKWTSTLYLSLSREQNSSNASH